MNSNPHLRKSSDYLNAQVEKAKTLRNEILEAKGLRESDDCNLNHIGCKALCSCYIFNICRKNSSRNIFK